MGYNSDMPPLIKWPQAGATGGQRWAIIFQSAGLAGQLLMF